MSDFLTHFGQMDITTAVGCAVGCAYCPQATTIRQFKRQITNPDRVMSLACFRACLSKIPTTIQINFAGYSEPFLNPDCVEMVMESAAKGHRTTLFTTMRGLSIEQMDTMSHIAFEAVEIHLPSTIGRQDVTFDDGYLDKLIAVDQKLTNVSYVLIDWQEEAIPLSGILDSIDKTKLFHEKANSRAGAVAPALIPPPTRHKGRLKCDRGLHSNVLMPNGDVTVCCQDFGLKHVIGNLLKDNYSDLFESDEFNRVVSGLNADNADTICRQCEYAINKSV